jgi:hypothetical protein
MRQATKEQQDRDRLREYEARVAAARESVAVLAQFAQAREARRNGTALEVEFATTSAEVDGAGLPASVWVGLRHDDLDAVLDTLIEHAADQFIIAEHEQLDADYRITTVAESRALPAVEALITQLAAFIQVPHDVVAMVSGWGADDPRTLAEIERLMDQRYGPPSIVAEPASTPARGTPTVAADRPTLAMSSGELTALLSLTPDQQAALATLVRQADVVVPAETTTSIPPT